MGVAKAEPLVIGKGKRSDQSMFQTVRVCIMKGAQRNRC
jgi:hypothetical protein